MRPTLLILGLSLAFPAVGDPSATGQTGLIAMPDARLAPDGTITGGFTFDRPYVSVFNAMTVLPRAEVSLRYTRIMGADFTSSTGVQDSDYKDKAADLKLVLLKESNWLPQVAFGLQDFHGTGLFPARYMVASKQFGEEFDLTLGYGEKRIDGAFGGLRWRPAWARGIGVAIEYDAYDYANDPDALDSGAARRDGGLAAALEYRWGWVALQMSHADGELGGRVSLAVPFGNAEFLPKFDEPRPRFTAPTPAPAATAWLATPDPHAALRQALREDGFGNVRLAHHDGVFEARLEHGRITLVGRTAGRAARTLLLFGPSDMRALRIIVTEHDIPLYTYDLTDPAKARAYFAGELAGAEFAPTVRVTYASPVTDERFRAHELEVPPEALGGAKTAVEYGSKAAGKLLAIERRSDDLDYFGIRPINLNGFFNDVNGAFKYEIYSSAGLVRHFGEGLFLKSSLRLQLLQNVDEARDQSSSELPHVRSDIPFYKNEGPLKLDALYLAKYGQLGERVYGRLSAGIYEEMFAGVGGQALWLAPNRPWAASFTVEAVQQRGFQGYFGFRDYQTVTALGAVHYRLGKSGVTLTARGGRFLARDEGVRFEFARRLRSGLKYGFWYTWTNVKDETGPGAPGDPYYDKGVFVSIPLHTMLTYDTKARASFGLTPWTRDVGQMVSFPDLYDQLEGGLLLDNPYFNPLTAFGQ